MEIQCPYGKASLCFPLAVSGKCALGLLAKAPDEVICADVLGYTTPLTREAGACSVRIALQLLPKVAIEFPPGSYAVVLRARGRAGWLPGLANTKHVKDGLLLEVVVLGRPDARLRAVMYLPEAVLAALWPCGAGLAEVQVLRPALLPQMADCPGQWLRDRLLKLADMLEDNFQAEASKDLLDETLTAAGLRLGDASVGTGAEAVLPADTGARTDKQELGYWKEEMDYGHLVAASMDGEQRMDVPDEMIQGML